MFNYLNETTKTYVMDKVSENEREYIYSHIQMMKSFGYKNFEKKMKSITIDNIKDWLA